MFELVNVRAGKQEQQAAHPDMEHQLLNEFREKRRDEMPVRRWWFAL